MSNITFNLSPDISPFNFSLAIFITFPSRCVLVPGSRVRQLIQPGTLKEVLGQEINAILAEALNSQLEAERDEALGRLPYERLEDSPKRNGFKLVSMPGFFGRLTLRKPVLRSGSLPSGLLTAIKTAGQSLAAFLPLKRLSLTSKAAIFVALGLDHDGKRYILGFMLGEKESLDAWETFLKDLLKRGLKPANLRLVLSDEHKAIEQAVKNLLPTPHQLCLVHKARNLKIRVHRSHWQTFYSDFHAIYWADSREDALRSLGRFQQRWQKPYPVATRIALDRFDDFTRFMAEPQALWRTLRSTNFIERFIREIKRRTRPAGTMHSELEVMKLAWSVSNDQEQNWQTRGLWRKSKAQGGETEKVLVGV